MPFNSTPLQPEQIATLKRWIDEGAEWPESAEARDQSPLRTLGLRQAGKARSADRQARSAGTQSDRQLHPGAPGTGRPDLFARSVERETGAACFSGFDRVAAIPCRSWMRFWPTRGPMPTSGWWTSCWPHLTSASAGPDRGWISRATPIPTATKRTIAATIWKYRDWVINALNRDMPFDEFTIEQIAGDMLPNATEDQRIATGFHRNTQFNEEGGVDKDESYFEVQVDRVATTGTVWLGSTLGCAQCHNHKFDPFTQRDFYSMMAFFNNVDKRLEDNGETPIYIEPVLEMPTPEQKAHRERLDARIKELAEKTQTMTPELKAEQTAWEKSVLDAEQGWRVIIPEKMTTAAGTTLTADAQGLIFAAGEAPRNEAYVIECKLPVDAAQGIRLEAVPNSKLPRGGPGRDPYGNFNITQIKLEIPDGTGWKAVAIQKIATDTGARSLDRKRGQLWTVDASREDQRLARQLVIVPENPITAREVRITLVQESEFSCQSVGYFRLSATGDSNPATVVGVSHSLRALLGKTGRTEDQEKKLADYFLTVAPSLQSARDELKQAKEDKKKLDITSTLVMRERPTFERPYDFIRIRGGFSAKADKVYANVPGALPPLPEDAMPNRLGLARWLVSKDNPLTARVAVNRIWEQYFGRGIVETSEDFGAQGQRPSHPELLDWLATEFMDRGWSMKAIGRLIVTSTAYRQSSSVTPELLAKDPYNRLLARGPRFRMEAEMVRDTVLAASGLLSPKIGGPSVYPPQPPGIWDMPYNDEVYVESQGEDRYRRGHLYFHAPQRPVSHHD